MSLQSSRRAQPRWCTLADSFASTPSRLPRCCSQGKQDARYCFTVKWYDPAASLERQYQLIYYTADGTIEMVSWRHL